MIEKTVLDYLSESIGVPAYMEMPEHPEGQFLVLEKIGGSKHDGIYTAMFAVQSYSGNLYKAAALNARVKDAMEEIVWLDSIADCQLNSDYNYTDTSTKRYRYQAVFDISYYQEESAWPINQPM